MINYFATDTVILHCAFDRNRIIGFNLRHAGGGLFTREESEVGRPLILNCSFTGNIAAGGGGLICLHDSNPLIVNTVFGGNVAQGSFGGAGRGGGMLVVWASPELVNCTFSGNIVTAERTGAGLTTNGGQVTTIKNCIFWGNGAGGVTDEGAQIYNEAAHSVFLDASCVQGAWSDGGTGNIALDPLFVDADGPDDIVGTPDDNLRLSSQSPCIDAGDGSELPADVFDLDGDGDTTEAIPHDQDGNPRLLGSDIDMGAYEYGCIAADADLVP